MNYRTIIVGFLLILSLSLLKCAQPVTPTGGEKDTSPPILTGTNPLPKSTNTSPKIIEFLFDENLQFNSPEKQIIISPIPKYKPQIIKSNKSFKIKFQDSSLLPNQTYSINLNDGISDLNEGNTGTYLPYLFSTGNTIDSAFVHGRLHYPDNNPGKNIILFAFNNFDSTVKYTAAIKNQQFFLTGLNSENKTITIFNDDNNSNTADSTEDIGILINQHLAEKDTLHINMYHRVKPIVMIEHYGNQSYLSGLPHFIQAKHPGNYEYAVFGDTLFSDSNTVNALLKPLNKNDYIFSVKFDQNHHPFSFYSEQKTINNSTTINLFCSHIINNINTLKIRAIRNSDTVTFPKENIKYQKNHISFSLQPLDTFDRIIISSGAIKYLNDSNPAVILLNTKNQNNSSLQFENKTSDTLNSSITSGSKVHYFILHPNTTKTINVPQGTYTGLFYKDLNKDHKLSPPNLKTFVQGEPWIKISDITANPSLENVIIVDF